MVENESGWKCKENANDKSNKKREQKAARTGASRGGCAYGVPLAVRKGLGRVHSLLGCLLGSRVLGVGATMN